MTEPVRDLFAALFYVSIGMLVNFADIGRFIGPVVLISLVLITGKVFANSLGIYLARRDTRTALEVGTAMPQPGELSLAVIKTGTDYNAVGAALSPVVTASILLTSLLYPVIFASSKLLERLIERKAPSLMRRHVTSVSESMAAAQQLMRAEGETSRRVQRQLSIAVINLGIIGLIVVAGVTMLRFTLPLAEGLHVSVGIVGLVLGGVLVTLSVPPGLTVWKSLAETVEELTDHLFLRRVNVKRDSFAGSVTSLFEHGVLAAGMFALAVWMTPSLLELVSVGELGTPVSVLIMIATMALTARIAVKIHTSLETTVERTFLGPEPQGEDDLNLIAHMPEPAVEPAPITRRNRPVL
jgi:CPA2 family monovalent cation:H+ antiporter-2